MTSHRYAPFAAGAVVVAMAVAAAWLGGFGDDAPPPLGLTSVAAGAEPAMASLDAAASPGRSGRYVLDGTLPPGPEKVPVHRLGVEAEGADVVRLATVLSLTTAPTRTGQRWEVTDGSRVLRVGTTAGNPWTYARDDRNACLPVPGAAPDEPVSCTAVAEPATSDGPGTQPGTQPGDARIDAAVARSLAEPTLRAAGLDPADAVVAVTGTQAVVRVDPVVDGVPTAGWSTVVTVDTEGVVTVTGWLATTTRPGPDYPIVTARAAFDRLDRGPVPLMACPEPGPASGSVTNPTLPGCGAPITLTGARLGLSLERTVDGPLLVPAWLFSVTGSSDPLAVVAVDPAFWGAPDDVPPPTADGGSGSAPGAPGGGSDGTSAPGAPGPAPGGPDSGPGLAPGSGPGTAVSSVHVADDGRSLDLVFYGAPEPDGQCGASYTASVKETDEQVVVAVTALTAATGVCPAIAAERHETVQLHAPLAERRVVDATTGASVPTTSAR